MNISSTLIIIVFIILSIISPTAHSRAILWQGSGSQSQDSPEPVRSQSIGTQRFNYDETQRARETSDFWQQRKMAVGVTSAGTYGIMGAVIGFYFHPQWSVDLGYGGGSHFASFGFRIKQLMLKSSPLNPYWGFGFHRWQRTNTRPFNTNDITPAFLPKRLMDDGELSLGRIDEKLVHGQLGLQYVWTQGSWEGIGLFGEVLMLLSVEKLKSVPTAAFGMNYFF